jgi:hypothetical protein
MPASAWALGVADRQVLRTAVARVNEPAAGPHSPECLLETSSARSLRGAEDARQPTTSREKTSMTSAT